MIVGDDEKVMGNNIPVAAPYGVMLEELQGKIDLDRFIFWPYSTRN